MRIPTRAALLAAVLAWTVPAQAVINKPISLKDDALREEFIFAAAIEKIEPDTPAVTFKLEGHLKGAIPIEQMIVNLTGSADAKKANHTQILLDRMEPGRKLIVFCSTRGKKYNAIAFMEGTWFSLQGTADADGKTIRWAFLNCEPNLRGTFKGSTAELKKVLEDAIAKRADPPPPNLKEPPGYGDPIRKHCGLRNAECGIGNRTTPSVVGPTIASATLPSAFRIPHSALLGVMPSVALIAPMAIIAALFPGVAARMAVGMKKWRAFLVISGMNSTLALVYFFLAKYKLLPDHPAFSLTGFTLMLMAITCVGLIWSGRRYRKLAAEDGAVSNPPSKVELWSLLGLTLFAAALAASTRFFGPWSAALEVPMREFTFIAVGLLGALLYSGYRAFAPVGANGPLHLSLSGESVGLGALFLCGFTAVLLSIGSGDTRTALIAPDSGDVKLTSITAFQVSGADQVMSGITVHGDRLYFGTSTLKLTSQDGSLICLDRTDGRAIWKYEGDDDLLAVFCTPTVAEGKVYFGEGLHEHKKCRFFCLDAATGKPAWENPIETASHTEGTPLVANDRVYFTAGDEGLHCVDARTGEKLWPEPFGGADKQLHIDGPPALAGNRVFAGSGIYSKAIFAVDAANGTELWRTPVPFRSFGKPLVLDDRVVYGIGTGNLLKDTETYREEGTTEPESSPGGALVCVEAATGTIAWQYDLTRSVHTPLAADSLFVYAASRDGCVHCLSRKSGKLRWKSPIGTTLTAGPAVARDEDGLPVAVYAVSTDGIVACLNPFTGIPYWVRDLREHTGQLVKDVVSTPVVVVEGKKRTLYVGAMTVSPNGETRTATVFRFDDAHD